MRVPREMGFRATREITMKRIANKVDKLAKLRADIDALKAEEAKLVEQLKAQGLGKYEGTEHYATVFEQAGRTSIDWQKIAMKFNPSPQLIAGNTKVGVPTVQLKLFGYPAAKAKAVAA